MGASDEEAGTLQFGNLTAVLAAYFVVDGIPLESAPV